MLPLEDGDGSDVEIEVAVEKEEFDDEAVDEVANAMYASMCSTKSFI